jgi:hypothetical protein
MKKITIKNSNIKILEKLKSSGNKKVNSMSYNIKNTHNIEKFKFICMFNSESVLNPHS